MNLNRNMNNITSIRISISISGNIRQPKFVKLRFRSYAENIGAIPEVEVVHLPSGKKKDWQPLLEKYEDMLVENDDISDQIKALEEEEAQLDLKIDIRIARVNVMKRKREDLLKEVNQKVLEHEEDQKRIEELEANLRLLHKTRDEKIDKSSRFTVASRSLHSKKEDKRFQEHFHLPETEFMIDSFFCVLNGNCGYVYISPSFLSFDVGWSSLPTGKPDASVSLFDIVKIKMSQFMLLSEKVEILLRNGEQLNFYFTKGAKFGATVFTKSVLRQAKKFGHDIIPPDFEDEAFLSPSHPPEGNTSSNESIGHHFSASGNETNPPFLNSSSENESGYVHFDGITTGIVRRRGLNYKKKKRKSIDNSFLMLPSIESSSSPAIDCESSSDVLALRSGHRGLGGGGVSKQNLGGIVDLHPSTKRKRSRSAGPSQTPIREM